MACIRDDADSDADVMQGSVAAITVVVTRSGAARWLRFPWLLCIPSIVCHGLGCAVSMQSPLGFTSIPRNWNCRLYGCVADGPDAAVSSAVRCLQVRMAGPLYLLSPRPHLTLLVLLTLSSLLHGVDRSQFRTCDQGTEYLSVARL